MRLRPNCFFNGVNVNQQECKKKHFIDPWPNILAFFFWKSIVVSMQRLCDFASASCMSLVLCLSNDWQRIDIKYRDFTSYHESWRMLQGLAHDWYCLMALVKVLGYIVDDGNVVGRNVKEAMNPRKLQSSERHWKQRKKRIDCWSFARFVACGTVLSCFVNMFWAVSVDDFDMTPYTIYALHPSLVLGSFS